VRQADSGVSINTELFIDRTEVPYMGKTRIRVVTNEGDQLTDGGKSVYRLRRNAILISKCVDQV